MLLGQALRQKGAHRASTKTKETYATKVVHRRHTTTTDGIVVFFSFLVFVLCVHGGQSSVGNTDHAEVYVGGIRMCLRQ